MFERRNKELDKGTLGEYALRVVSLPEECAADERLPIELVFIFRRYPEHRSRVRALLKNGRALGVQTMVQTPESVLRAVHTISVYSQANFILSWLPALLRDKHQPIITESDRAHAAEHKENIDEALELILRDHVRYKQFTLINESNQPLMPLEEQLLAEMNELLYPLQIEYALFRLTVDNAHERTQIAQAIIKVLFIVGPIAHILEKFAAGVGKIFAASTDDLLGETAELMALRGSGFSWRELRARLLVLIPVFLLASYGAFSVEHLLTTGHTVWGGVVFGLSAVALSLTTAVQSLFMYRRNLKQLMAERKVAPSVVAQGAWHVVIRQDFTNPARLGLLIGAACAPFFGIAGSLLHLMHNGWVLAAIGSTESVIAGLTVIFASQINERRFQSTLRSLAYQAPQE